MTANLPALHNKLEGGRCLSYIGTEGDANRALGFRDDERDYAIAAHMLDVASVRLMTNNPDKIRQLEKHGVLVTGRIPHVMPATEQNRFYLETKAARSGHDMDFADAPRMQPPEAVAATKTPEEMSC